VTTLLAASNGGHLKQLHCLRPRLRGVPEPFEWITFDTAQARSLLEGETVHYVPFIGGRDPRNVAGNVPYARRILRETDAEALVSTGSAIALPYFALGRMRGRRCHWIESATRVEGPSLTGRLVSRIPGVKLYAQYESWAEGRWSYRGGVFDSFVSVEASPPVEPTRVGKVVVTLGTYKGTPYTRIVRRLLEILPPEVEVLWQTGETDVSSFGINGVYALPERELSEAMREADVVVAHAGVGTALAALELSKCPVLAPRRAALGESVDDHQSQIAAELSDRRLAVSVDAEEISFEHLREAAGRRVAVSADPPEFELVG
jgi:UDP-N-acetylglucosamine--N-acetylmuramyl-(pentapeptide) pyrophosphoryl-undecaprenol N-acetylglucosamine transferase